jgi:hypothetical protein
MARLGTALQRQPDPPPPAPARGPLGPRLAGALSRRSGGEATPAGRTRRAVAPLGDRLLLAVERRLAHAVEQRLSGAPSARRPGPFEQRVVAALERRLGRRGAVDGGPSPGAGWIGQARQRHRPGRGLPATREKTLRALAVGLVARGVVRALALFVRLLGRSLVSGPARRLARLLARRAIRARPTHQAGFLALLLGAWALAARILTRRLGALTESRRAAILLAVRLARIGLPGLRRLLAGLLRALAGLARRGVRRAAAPRRSDQGAS